MFSQRLRPIILLVVIAATIGLALFLSTGTSASVTVEWSTASELNTAGFNLYRGESPDGPFEKINTELIPASTDPLVGGSYAYTDTNVIAGHTYFYRLEDVETSGRTSLQGTVEVTAGSGAPLPLMLAAAVIVIIAAIFWLRK